MKYKFDFIMQTCERKTLLGVAQLEKARVTFDVMSKQRGRRGNTNWAAELS